MKTTHQFLLSFILLLCLAGITQAQDSTIICPDTLKDLKQSSINIEKQLEGTVSNCFGTKTDKDTGTTTIRIRCTASTLLEPLYIIDGIVCDSLPKVEEIESIEVLRSEKAIPIYGVRAKGGVVLIKMKKKKKKRLRFKKINE